MSDLINKKCVPCEGGVIPFDISEIHKYQKKIDGWEIIKSEKNRLVIFPANVKHTGTTCTDKDERIVLNINYY